MAAPAPERLGPFRVVRHLGRGGMGSVYEVVDPQLGRRVALKLIEGRADPTALERFRREAHVLARLQHPGVVRVHRLGDLPQGPFILEELVAGERLRDVAARGPLAPRQAAELARGLADALADVHALGVVHRDLKPENVIVRPDGAPVLIDFGIARDADAETLTRTGALVGTLAYMAPEQVRSRGAPVDGRADVYALGVVLYELLSGRPPFEGAPIELLARILHDVPPPLTRLRPDVPPDLDAIVQVALARSPDERHAGAAAMRDELDRFLRDERTASAERVASQARALARRLAARLAGAAALLGVAAAPLALWALSGEPAAAPRRPRRRPTTSRPAPAPRWPPATRRSPPRS
ncbi:MAG: serine/threonine protein kinase [Planctomycetes bacterium]|nr:serine/threonine protein kinase [Planctomycetota bacterium]